MGGEILVLSGEALSKIEDQKISRLIEEYRGYPGEGYCELEDEILVCVASIPRLRGEPLSGLILVRTISAVDPRGNRVYLYVEGGETISAEDIAGRRRSVDAAEVFQAMLEYMYKEYRGVLDEIESTIDKVEEMVEREELVPVAREIYRLRKTLIDIRKGLRNYIQMLRQLHGEQMFAKYVKNHGRLFELIDELSIGLETIEVYREMLIGIRETHATLVGLKLNEVVKRLTAITLVLMIPTLIASIYGMNFDTSYPLNMPELSWSFGYIYALSLMVISSIAGYLILKARGWF
ncbi:MAG: magnesium transporter CorA family protein [Desulfurococcales archaeon]|nr:magnesium transporter CorA family protein [Desulfurococcales archaeon]